MAPETIKYLIVATWVVGVVGALWCWVPFFLMCVVGSGYENGGTEDPTAIEPDGSDANYDVAFNTLRELGYEPLGSGFMRLWFYGWYWTYRTKVMAFRSRPTGQFAFIQQHPFPLTGYDQVFFVTCWNDQRLLTTTGGMTTGAHRDEQDRVMVWPTENIQELECHHREEVSKLLAEGWQRDSDLSLENLLSATRESARRCRGHQSRMFRVNLITMFSLYLIGIFLPAWWLGWHWLAPVLALVYLVILRIADADAKYEFASAYRLRISQDRTRGPVFADSKVGTP